MMPKDALSSVALKNIRRRYENSQFTLRIKNLEFDNRSIHIVAGPNGSGKSTLLKIIALLDKPDEGCIFFNGAPAYAGNGNCIRLRRKIGFIAQSPYLFNTSVIENVALGLKIRRYPKSELLSRTDDMLAALGISHLAKRRVNNLSRGEYQKVAIAQILVFKPDIILMDEPAANIDLQSTLSIEKTIRNIHRRFNSIIIMTTHSLTQAYRISRDIIAMDDGNIADFTGEKEAVFAGEKTLRD